MKKFLLISGMVIGGLAASPVSAEEYCCPVDTCCDVGFNGFYIGGNVGAFTHTAHRNDLDGFLTDNSGWSFNSTDVTAGLQLGYDWQCNSSALWGLVVDWNWVNTRHRHRDNPSIEDGNTINAEFNWFTTIRARAGVTVCDALVYVTGGAAVARFDTRWANEPTFFRHRESRWGWTGGFGAEFALGCNWSIGAEFLFLHFDETTRSFTGDDATFAFGHSDSAWLGRLMLNYRFGDLLSCCW